MQGRKIIIDSFLFHRSLSEKLGFDLSEIKKKKKKKGALDSDDSDDDDDIKPPPAQKAKKAAGGGSGGSKKSKAASEWNSDESSEDDVPEWLANAEIMMNSTAPSTPTLSPAVPAPPQMAQPQLPPQPQQPPDCHDSSDHGGIVTPPAAHLPVLASTAATCPSLSFTSRRQYESQSGFPCSMQ